MRAAAMLKNRIGRLLPGARVPDYALTNLSFVLHERSDSAAVLRAAQQAVRHAKHAGRVPASLPLVEPRALPANVDIVLSAQIGLPARLAQLVRNRAQSAQLRFVDHLDGAAAEIDLFRAPARLTLPHAPARVAVAAVLLRPGGDSAQLSVAGPFDWPNQQVEVLHALERLLQSYTDQWLPRAALWPAPAEELLPAEIG
jgi:hypothetical protein